MVGTGEPVSIGLTYAMTGWWPLGATAPVLGTSVSMPRLVREFTMRGEDVIRNQSPILIFTQLLVPATEIIESN